VNGGAGGVGTAGIQIARAAGARVVASVRNEELRPEVEKLGATVVAPDGFEDHGPFDVVLELVGGPNIPGALKSLETLGRIVVIGMAGGPKAELFLPALAAKRATIRASHLRNRPLEDKADAMRRVERQVLPLVEQGAVRVRVSETFPLDRAEAAYDRFAAGGKLGKIVLTMG